jgi:hypothetical protein
MMDTPRHTTNFPVTKRGYKTIHGHKYVSTCKSYKVAKLTVWPQNPKVRHRTHNSPPTVPILSPVRMEARKTRRNAWWMKHPMVKLRVCVLRILITKVRHCIFRTITRKYKVSFKNSPPPHRLRSSAVRPCLLQQLMPCNGAHIHRPPPSYRCLQITSAVGTSCLTTGTLDVWYGCVLHTGGGGGCLQAPQHFV